MKKFVIVCILVITAIQSINRALAGPVDWAAWSSNTSGTVTTPGGNISLIYSGELDGFSNNFVSWNPSTSYADGSIVENAPPESAGVIQLTGGSNTVNTVSFSTPVVDPVFSIWSLGNADTTATFVFSETPTLVAGGPSDEFGGQAITLATGNTVQGNEGNGTIMFLGTFSNISWENPISENNYAFTIGVEEVPEPSTWVMFAAGTASLFAIRRCMKHIIH